MRKKLLIIWVSLLLSLQGGELLANPYFYDSYNHWARESIEFVSSEDLLMGVREGCFNPDAPITREMFVTVLGRLAKIDASYFKAPAFYDISGNSYCLPYVQWAADHEIVEGIGNGYFGPQLVITREQIAVMIKRYAEFMDINLPPTQKMVLFADGWQISDWARDAVFVIQEAGLMHGKAGGRFDPKSPATRAEVAVIIERLAHLSEQ